MSPSITIITIIEVVLFSDDLNVLSTGEVYIFFGTLAVPLYNCTYIYIYIYIYIYTVPSRKSAHGWCTLHWAQTEGWADIRVTTAAFLTRKSAQVYYTCT